MIAIAILGGWLFFLMNTYACVRVSGYVLDYTTNMRTSNLALWVVYAIGVLIPWFLAGGALPALAIFAMSR